MSRRRSFPHAQAARHTSRACNWCPPPSTAPSNSFSCSAVCSETCRGRLREGGGGWGEGATAK